MGKRKTKRKAPPKRQQQKLDKEFNCPICFADKAVEVHLNQKAGAASTLCRACRHTFETSITPIDAEIDVYAAWVDAVEDGTAGNGAQQTMLAEDLAAIPQTSSRQDRKLPRGGPTNKRQRVAHHEVDEEAESDRYLGEDDSEDNDDEAYGFPMQQSRPVAAAKPVAAEDEIELPDEEEEYDFGDNNDDDDDGDEEEEDEDRNARSANNNPANEGEPNVDAADAPTWDQDEV